MRKRHVRKQPTSLNLPTRKKQPTSLNLPTRKKQSTNVKLLRGIAFALMILALIIAYFLESSPDNTPIKESTINKPNNALDNLYQVTSIIDGDTIYIEGGEKVRLVCINTPEVGEEGYEEARDYLESLVLYHEISLEKDKSERDQYGRLLRYVYTWDGRFVNEMLVREGYAKAYRFPPDTKYCDLMEKAEASAKAERLGLWKNKVVYSPDKKKEYSCEKNIYNCNDFDSRAEAQKVLDLCGGIAKDIHGLDVDRDGIACESLS